jgi:tetratricopeptide (TPR) repeat protein
VNCSKLGLYASVLTLCCAVGCAHQAPRETTPRKARRRIQIEPFKLIASPRKDIEILDATGLFESAGRLLGARKYREALVRYDRLIKHFPKTGYLAAALYNAGLAHEGLLDYLGAAKRYRALIKRFGATRDAIDGAFRLGGCLAEVHNWQASRAVYAKLLSRKELSSGDRIEAYARKGLAEFRVHDHAAANKTLSEAVAFARKLEGVERLDNDFFLGMAHYYLAAVPHVKFRNARVTAGKVMGKQLDLKARLLVLSQRRYIRTIRIKNPYWATAAGFQVGSLYKEFYTTLMTVLPDFRKVAKKNAKLAKISVDKAHRQLVRVYLEEVHKKVKPLLKKAIRVFEKTVVMGERVGIKSRWVKKSRSQMASLKRLLLAKPEEAIKMLPKRGVVPEDEKGAAPPANKGSTPTSSDQPPVDKSEPGQRTIL